jgi:hypothetical protein
MHYTCGCIVIRPRGSAGEGPPPGGLPWGGCRLAAFCSQWH